MKDRLRPCPFCGADQNGDSEYTLTPAGGGMSRHCMTCGAEAPLVWLADYETREDAMDAADRRWNERA